jgi:hypothetical protein
MWRLTVPVLPLESPVVYLRSLADIQLPETCRLLIQSGHQLRRDELMKRDRITSIGIDDHKRLWIRPAEHQFPYIYREAMEVDWDAKEKRLVTPHRPEWSYARWFDQIVLAAREQGTELYIDAATTWQDVDVELRQLILAQRAAI